MTVVLLLLLVLILRGVVWRLLGLALFFPWCMLLGLEGRLLSVLRCSWSRWLDWVYSGNVLVLGGVSRNLPCHSYCCCAGLKNV